MTSSGSDWRSRIRQQEETAKQQIEEVTQRELENFGERLRHTVSNGLSTIESATADMSANVRKELRRVETTAIAQLKENERTIEAASTASTGRVYALLLRTWMVSARTGFAIFLGIFVASWGLMQWLPSEVMRRFELLRELQLQIRESADVTLLTTDEGRRFLVLPAGTTVSPPFVMEDGRTGYELFRQSSND